MKANEQLAKIPIASIPGVSQFDTLKISRKFTQIGFIVLLVMIPVLGIFRIDVSAGFVVLGRQIWFADFAIVFGFWLALACSMIMLYSAVGTAFCGWFCPQHTFSALADQMTAKMLGKRAVIDWETKTTVAKNKNAWQNWLLLGAKLFGIAMLVGLIPLFYFVPPEAVWSFVTFQQDARLAGSLHWIYTVFVFIVFVNLAVIRHYMCRYMCIYRMWQFLFKTRDTLHVEYDADRSDECEKCNYCVTQCMVDIDPKQTSTYDSCTNCSACISACNAVQGKQGKQGLLRFKLGPRKHANKIISRIPLPSWLQRLRWISPVFLLGAGLFVWGLVSYDPFHIAVYKADIAHGEQINQYRVHIANKMYRPSEVHLSIEGLAEDEYHLSVSSVKFDTVDRFDVVISIHEGLAPGLHSFIVRASSDDGWEERFRVQHFIGRG